MNLQDTLSHRQPIIEPLEQRIAPALLVTGANLLGGAGNPTSGQASIGGNSLTLVKVLSGEAIVWYDHGAIEGISVGPNTSLDITGDVGFIVGNLTASGQLSNSAPNAVHGLDGGALLPNNIIGITTHPLGPEPGSIGEIITGGAIENLNIAGYLSGVYAGNAAFDHSGSITLSVSSDLDLNPIMPGDQSSFVLTSSHATVLSGASIINATIGIAQQLQLFAGNAVNPSNHTAAMPGLPGGYISGITIDNATSNGSSPSYTLQAGNGSDGVSGGAGGGIFNIKEVLSSYTVSLLAGHGGNGTKGAGGAGGSIKGLNMQSDSTAYTITAGAGGVGTPGGAGGSVTNVNFSSNALSSGLVVAGKFTGGTAQDVLLIDGQTGNMIVEQNNGNGTGFTPIVQDPYTNPVGYTIPGDGTQPVAAVAVNISGSGPTDVVVAYQGTSNLGVFLNQGGGVFTVPTGPVGAYTGTSPVVNSVTLPFAPAALTAGNFTGDAHVDLAVLATVSGQSELLTLTGDGIGNFTLPATLNPGILITESNPVSLVTANIQNGSYQDLIGGFKGGVIDSFLSTGATSGAAFSVVYTGITVSGGLGNLDYDSADNLLLALNSTGSTLGIYASQSGGTLAELSSIALTQQPGTALVAHFVPGSGFGAEDIEVLSKVGSGATLDLYTMQNQAYVLASSTTSTEALRNFSPVLEGATTGVASVGTSVEHFAFSQNGAAFYDIGLPFSGKSVYLYGGDGGDGATGQGSAGSNLPAKGGAGGEIYGMNIVAGVIDAYSGAGGIGSNAAGGAGGLIGNSASVTVGGQTFATNLAADSTLTMVAGAGGDAVGSSHAAIGGAGGSVKGLDVSMLSGTITITAGIGGDGGGGAAGVGGSVLSLKSVSAGGDLDVTAGAGGSAFGAIGNGGAGGSIVGLTHTLSLSDQTQESAYNVNLIAGAGGSSASAVGGAGGSVGAVSMTLQPSNESVNSSTATPPTTHSDANSTLDIVITAGNGGNGAAGGAGGSLKGITSTSVFDQIVIISPTSYFDEINPVAATLTAGNGGNGSKTIGGAGGSISAVTLNGISHYDPDTTSDPEAGTAALIVTSGNGGNGATTGGAGGAIIGLIAQNAQFSAAGATPGTGIVLNHTQLSGATITSGHGGNGGTGNGGAGGVIGNISVGVEASFSSSYLATSDTITISGGGALTIAAGAGGSGGTSGKGGAGGAIINDIVGSADAVYDYGLLLQAGAGGAGSLGGGAGGAVTNLQLNAPANPLLGGGGGYDALSSLILAGDGGAATGATATGGVGGSISGIAESKDVNTSINLLQAGNGGNAVKTGGLGGSVTNVKTVGLIGQASDDYGNTFGVFQTNTAPGEFDYLFPNTAVPQGVFAGRGGTGATAGLAGSVTGIDAYAIDAIGAAMDPTTGLFAAAQKVADITATSVGFLAQGDTAYTGGTARSNGPDLVVPADGFIISVTTPTAINVPTGGVLATFVGPA